MTDPKSAAAPRMDEQGSWSILAAMAPVVKRAVKFFEVAVLRLSAPGAYTSAQMSESARDCDSSLGQLRPMLLTLQAYADAAAACPKCGATFGEHCTDAAPRQPEGPQAPGWVTCRNGYPSMTHDGPHRQTPECVSPTPAPKSEPEGPQDLTEDEIEIATHLCGSFSAGSVSSMFERMLAEVRRHRAQPQALAQPAPADAAPLDALRELERHRFDMHPASCRDCARLLRAALASAEGASAAPRDERPEGIREQLQEMATRWMGIADARGVIPRRDCALELIEALRAAAPLGAPDARREAQGQLSEIGLLKYVIHSTGCQLRHQWCVGDEKLCNCGLAAFVSSLLEKQSPASGPSSDAPAEGDKARAVLRRGGRHE